VVWLAETIVKGNLLPATPRCLDLKQKLKKLFRFRIFHFCGEVSGNPEGNWRTAGYEAASFKMIHKIVYLKIGIHF